MASQGRRREFAVPQEPLCETAALRYLRRMTQARPNWTVHAQRDSAGGIPVVIGTGGTGGTLLLIHGRNGAPDQPHIAEIAAAYLARGWRVIAPELPHSSALPASGPPSDVTLAGHTAAARQVLHWIRSSEPETPVALAGHSIGGYTVGRLSCEPGLHHILAVSPVLSGPALLAARRAMGPDAMAELEREAPAYRAELETADAAPVLAGSTAPVAVITGAEDGLVTLDHARAWFAAAPGARFFAALPGQHHCPEGPACATALAAALDVLDP